MFDPQSGTSTLSVMLKAWDDYVAASQAMLERFKNPAAAGTHTSLPFFGNWQELAASLGMNSKPNEIMSGMAPALGLTREYQTILQHMTELGSQFQQRYAEFLKHSTAIGEQALQAVQKRTAAEPTLVSSPAAAYDAWIDSAETAYAQAAHSDSFAQSLAELCNLMSAFKVERGKLLEAFAKHLDLPSRAEVDSLHRKVRNLTLAARANIPASPAGNVRVRAPRKPVGK